MAAQLGFQMLQRYLPHRRPVIVLAHAGLVAAAYLLAILLRFDFNMPPDFWEHFALTIPLLLGIRLAIFAWYRLYQGLWRYVSMYDILKILKAVTVGSLIFVVGVLLLFGHGFPRSLFILEWLLSLALVGGMRLATRAFRESSWRPLPTPGGKWTLIVGAGDAGEQLVRAMLHERRSQYFPMGFVDDDPRKQGVEIHGVRVLGKRADIPRLVKKHEVEELLIAMPSAPSRVIQETVELGRQAGLTQIKILPSFHAILSGQVRLADIREVQLEDLLGREPVRLDVRKIEGYLRGRTVLVTGAAGSIGRELCNHIARFHPQTLFALDQDESGLFYLENELKEKFSELELEAIVANIRDRSKVERIFQAVRPQVIFHAAAYKHVPFMEFHPDEAVKNNVFGMLIVAEAAQQSGTEKFVLISTDKAVNPTSVMGATKRVAEMVVQTLNQQGRTKFMAVRFGNVLDSRGNVISIFQEQIRRGGPVTVTHEAMKRYFMVTSEAVLLVLQAGVLGEGGEVFVLDMGEPVRIADLAREMIRLSGYEPDKDIPIVYNGPRPGEKLFEDLLTAEEGTIATQHEQIFVAKLKGSPDKRVLQGKLGELKRAAECGDRKRIIELLRELVPTYRPGSPVAGFKERGAGEGGPLRRHG